MKKYLAFVMAVAVAFIGTGCTIIEPGHVGIKVNNLGSNRGVQNYTITTGMVWYFPPTTTIFNYPTSMQTAIWTSSPHEGNSLNEEITFNTKEGTAVSGDISLSYQLVADSVPRFYVKFRSDKIEIFTHGYLRNIARDAFNEIGSNYTLEEVYGLKKEEFLKAVKARVNLQVNNLGVEVSQFGFTGALRMDPGIMASLNKKLQAIQDAITAENQLRQAEAVAKNRIAAAEGEARANTILSQSMTPILLQLKQLEVQRAYIEKWDTHLPSVLTTGNSGNGMLLQLPTVTAK